MTPDTIFQIYSMSKAVTSVAAMMLIDEGKLALDDSISKYIHSFAEAKVGVDISDEAGKYPLKLEPLKRPITIRDLLRHTSGITTASTARARCRNSMRILYCMQGISITPTSPTGSQCCRLPISPQRAGITAIQPTCSPCRRGGLGQTLYQFEKQRLFDPLGMSDTMYYVADKRSGR